MSPDNTGSDDSVEDRASIGHDAQNADERNQALVWALTTVWDRENIARVERLDTDTGPWHGWLMWRRS
jgi:hypothetical protein